MWTIFPLEITLSPERWNRSIDPVQLDRSTFLESEVWEVDELFTILEEEIGVNKREKLSWMSISIFVSVVVDFISFLIVHSRYHLQRLVHNESNCRLVFLEIDTSINSKQRHTVLSPLHSKATYPFVCMLTKDHEPLWYQVQQLDSHQSQPSITIII